MPAGNLKEQAVNSTGRSSGWLCVSSLTSSLTPDKISNFVPLCLSFHLLFSLFSSHSSPSPPPHACFVSVLSFLVSASPPPSALPSVQATGPFLHIGALAAATALSWIVAGQVARAERTSEFEREAKLNYSSSLYWPGRKCGE